MRLVEVLTPQRVPETTELVVSVSYSVSSRSHASASIKAAVVLAIVFIGLSFVTASGDVYDYPAKAFGDIIDVPASGCL